MHIIIILSTSNGISITVQFAGTKHLGGVSLVPTEALNTGGI